MASRTSRLERYKKTVEQLKAEGASNYEAVQAARLGELLGPALRLNEKDRAELSGGDKSLLGTYRTLKAFVGWRRSKNDGDPHV